VRVGGEISENFLQVKISSYILLFISISLAALLGVKKKLYACPIPSGTVRRSGSKVKKQRSLVGKRSLNLQYI
jgi:hypothetical protein